jgi:hypothetical protein
MLPGRKPIREDAKTVPEKAIPVRRPVRGDRVPVGTDRSGGTREQYRVPVRHLGLVHRVANLDPPLPPRDGDRPGLHQAGPEAGRDGELEPTVLRPGEALGVHLDLRRAMTGTILTQTASPGVCQGGGAKVDRGVPGVPRPRPNSRSPTSPSAAERVSSPARRFFARPVEHSVRHW